MFSTLRLRALRHTPSVLLFAVLAIAWSYPLLLHLGTHIPGADAGDNLSFVWNLWWMRTAWRLHSNPFFSSYLFAPIGVDLTQHTYTPLSGAIGATALASLSPLAAQNVLLLATLVANGLVTYALAYRLARDRFAAICAGITFAGAAPLLVRLQGHFNLVGAWVLPLFAYAFLRALDRNSARAWLGAGAVLGVAVYCDYYYVVYAMVFAAICLVGRWLRIRVSAAKRVRPRRVSRCLLALLAVDVIAMIVIAATGGSTFNVGPLHVQATTSHNEKVAFWLLLAIWFVLGRRFRFEFSLRPDVRLRSELTRVAVFTSGFVLVALPIIVQAAHLLYAHEYTSQRYGWRSAPSGIDVASFLVGNPLNAFYGAATRAAYAAMAFNRIEGVGWIPAAALVVVAFAWSRLRGVREIAYWKAVAVVFFVWSLGPHLDAFGIDTGMLLPETFIRWIPVVSNARIPGRAIVMTVLAVSMLLAFVVARAEGWSHTGKALLLVLLLFDCATAPLALYRPESNSVYSFLRSRNDTGTILELPLGIRDGFGEVGKLDERMLYYQQMAAKPMMGGFVARLPQSIRTWYGQTPIVSTLLRLSECSPMADPPPVSRSEAYEALNRASVRYVVLNRDAACPALLAYVSQLPLERLTEDRGRVLFELRRP